MNVDFLRDLCRRLGERQRPEDVADALGTTTEDQGGDLALVVRPADPSFGRTLVVRRPEGGVSHVELTPAGGLSVDELTRALGQGSRAARLHAGRPAPWLFPLGDCTVIADLDEDERVTTLKLRHDGTDT